MTATITEDVVQTNTTDDPDEAAHIVSVPKGQPDKSPQAYVLRARIEGFAIKAWCGHEFIPKQDPVPLPVCEPCLAIYKHDPHGKGDRDRLPDA